MATPDDRRYTDQHEWALVHGTDGTATVVRVGITDHAQDALGDIVFVQLPDVGETVGPENPIGEVESTKSVSDVYAPVSGTVVDRNTKLTDDPELVNRDPYGDGWMIAISPADGTEVEGLLEAGAYRELTETEGSTS
jgi:glycine cleavage system H protein